MIGWVSGSRTGACFISSTISSETPSSTISSETPMDMTCDETFPHAPPPPPPPPNAREPVRSRAFAKGEAGNAAAAGRPGAWLAAAAFFARTWLELIIRCPPGFRLLRAASGLCGSEKSPPSSSAGVFFLLFSCRDIMESTLRCRSRVPRLETLDFTRPQRRSVRPRAESAETARRSARRCLDRARRGTPPAPGFPWSRARARRIATMAACSPSRSPMNMSLRSSLSTVFMLNLIRCFRAAWKR
mmetsp:Transcript_22786/g.35810  ORF Transcript_22786/g.35810 Transcript_22786/m.35810 type:complete len:244 (+) Transcript_22786:187-918(+)